MPPSRNQKVPRPPKGAPDEFFRLERTLPPPPKGEPKQPPAEPALISIMWVKRAVAVFLWPVCWLATAALFKVFRAAEAQDIWHSPEVWLFSAGFGIWLLVFFLLPRPTGFYVIGHEYTHYVFIKLFLGRIGRVVTTREGGYVLTNRTNFLITLAPYFFPFWTLVSLLILYGARLAVTVPWFDHVLFMATGVTWSFHLTFTVSMILKGQPDIEENGRTFSFTFIYLCNMLAITAMLVLASPRVEWPGYWQAVVAEAVRLAHSASSLAR